MSLTVMVNGFSQKRTNKPKYDFPYLKCDGYCLGQSELNIDMYAYETTEDSIYFRSPAVLSQYLKDKDEEDFIFYLLDESKEVDFYDLSFRQKLYYPIHRVEDRIFIQRRRPPSKLIKIPQLSVREGRFACLITNSNHPFFKIKAIPNDPNITIETSTKHRVVCQGQITPRVILEISSALEKEGYLDDKEISEFNSVLKDALYEFQFDNDLKIGFLDAETLDLLGFTDRQIEILVGINFVREEDNPDFSNMEEEEFMKWWKKKRVAKFVRGR